MSTSGTYHYWPKVVNPHSVLPQMTGDTHLPPFFFGASQVPINLHLSTGSGIRRKFKNSITMADTSSLHGRGLHPTYEHTDRIMLPKGFKKFRR